MRPSARGRLARDRASSPPLRARLAARDARHGGGDRRRHRPSPQGRDPTPFFGARMAPLSLQPDAKL